MAKSIVIIGGGPGGEAAAKRAAARGARVTLVEKNRLGGVCLNWGCIPSKALLEAGRLSHAVSAAGATTSGGAGVRVRWTDLQKKKDELVSALRASLTQNYQRLGVRVVEGAASFADPATVAVKTTGGTERLPFDAAVVATGSAPFFPPPFDALAGTFLDSDRALSLDRVPASIAVVGGGAVGCEFACLFRELGAAVTIIEKTEGLLPGE
ncbi:MAG TPA: FAD-dependent oxidoreductase, partial [Elusimicrobiota bacterium]|nr:FAD-dependent oxidoreductase [Elusimicrobiota bacterium]